MYGLNKLPVTSGFLKKFLFYGAPQEIFYEDLRPLSSPSKMDATQNRNSPLNRKNLTTPLDMSDTIIRPLTAYTEEGVGAMFTSELLV